MSWYDDLNWGGAAKGAGGGALAGGAFGPWGAAIGGVAGGAIGLFSGGESKNDQSTRNMLMDYYKSVQSRQPYNMAPTQYGQISGDVRNQQQSLNDQLTALSQGKGPSLAEQQLRSATDRNVSQAAGFANSGRGGPMAVSQAANNQARMGAQASQDAASARIAESNQARQLLGLNLHGMREQDENMSQFNAGQGNQMSQAQLLALIHQRQMQDQGVMGAIGGLQGQNTAQYGRPQLSDQILAGGAGLYSLAATQRAQAKAAGK